MSASSSTLANPLWRIEGDAYGASIHREILDATGRDVSIPAVYVTLKRMERKGLVASRMGASEAGGRTTRNYRIRPAGREALARARALLEALWEGADAPASGGASS